jgi:hypothetical protein
MRRLIAFILSFVDGVKYTIPLMLLLCLCGCSTTKPLTQIALPMPPVSSVKVKSKSAVIVVPPAPTTITLGWTPNYANTVPAPFNAEVTGIVMSPDCTVPLNQWPTIWTGHTNQATFPRQYPVEFFAAYNTWTNI